MEMVMRQPTRSFGEELAKKKKERTKIVEDQDGKHRQEELQKEFWQSTGFPSAP